MVIVVENAPARLRGRLAAWLIEVRAGVYVGSYGRKTREMIWENVEKYLDQGDAIMAWDTPSDQGFDFVTFGKNRRMPVDFDGVSLVKYRPKNLPK